MGAESAGWTVAVIGGHRRTPVIMRQAGTAPKRTGYNEWQVIMRMTRQRGRELSRA